MNFLEIIKTRRSIRKYLNKPIEQEKISEILNCARFAPSSGNIQNSRFIIVTKQDKKKEIAEACLNQYWIETAPVLIIICSDTKQIKRYYEKRGEKLYAIQNTSLIAQNIMLAAHSLNLGTCFVSAFNETAIKRILKIPEEIKVHIIITLGYPNENPRVKKDTIESLLFFEEWGKKRKSIEPWPLKKHKKLLTKKSRGILSKLKLKKK